MPEKLPFIQKIFSWSDTAMAFWALVFVLSLGVKEVVQWLRKRFSKPKLKPYLPDNIEIGFSRIGPTICMDLTLRSEVKDVFVAKIVCFIRNLRTNESHEFRWFTFNEYRPDPKSNIIRLFMKEHANPFVVPLNSSIKTNILFYDVEGSSQIHETLRKALESLKEENKDMFEWLEVEEIKEIYQESQARVSAYTEIDRLFYWKAESYQIITTFEIEGASGHTVAQEFSIGSEEEDLLRQNVLSLVNVVEVQDNDRFNFIRPNLVKQ